MTLLWDGTFHGNETRTNTNVFNDPNGNYQSYCCLPQPDSFQVVPAPGGRAGYAGKFYTGVGSAYGCNGNKHDDIIANFSQLHHDKQSEFYFGWSQYIEEPWLQSAGINTWMVGTGLSAHVKTTDGVGFYIVSYGSQWRMAFTAVGVETTFSYDNMGGKWYDFILKAKLTTDATGYHELYMRAPGGSYVLVDSRYNYITDYPQPGSEYFDIRVGLYTNLLAPYGQTVYVLNPKIGTTQADVEYVATTSEPTIIISPVDGGTVQTVKDGINTIFTAIPAEGYVFDHFNDVWTNNNQNFYVNPWTDAASSADTITAFFVYIPPPVPTTSHLSVSIKGGQGAIMMDGDPHAIYQTIETDLPIGYNLILEGVPAQDNVFHHWYDIVNAAETITNPITLRVTGDMVFELYFGYVAPPPPPPPPPPPQPQDAGGAAFMVIGGYLILKATGVIK